MKLVHFILVITLACLAAAGSTSSAAKTARVTIPAGTTQEQHCNANSCILLYLGDARVLRRGKAFQVAAGDVDIFYSGSSMKIRTGKEPLRFLRISLDRPLTSRADCECGDLNTVLCGCGGQHLPKVWSKTLGKITLSGYLLSPGEQMEDASHRNKTLVAAISNVDLADKISPERHSDLHSSISSTVFLSSGETTWLKPGRHTIRNEAPRSARFFMVEF